jgi:hypothetical protein
MMAALSAWATSDEGSATDNFWGRSTPAHAQTMLSAQHPAGRAPSGRPPSGSTPPGVPFRPPSTPTPASFGATRDPGLSAYDVPTRSNTPLFLVLSGVALILLLAGALVFRHMQSKDVATAASSAVQPPASSTTQATAANAPVVAAPPAPTEDVSPVDQLPGLSLPSESEAPREPSPLKLDLAPRAPSKKRGSPAATPSPGPRAAPVEPELEEKSKPTPGKQPTNWGY